MGKQKHEEKKGPHVKALKAKELGTCNKEKASPEDEPWSWEVSGNGTFTCTKPNCGLLAGGCTNVKSHSRLHLIPKGEKEKKH